MNIQAPVTKKFILASHRFINRNAKKVKKWRKYPGHDYLSTVL
jgi:hypothetical protein